jgi:hypothetical protein
VNPTLLRSGPLRAAKKSTTAANKPPKKSAAAKQKPSKPAAAPRPARAPAAQEPRRGIGRVALQAMALLIMAVCAAIVLKLTLTPSPASVGIAHTNLTPGATIKLYLDNAPVREAILQIGGNIVIGGPFGLLLPSISPRFRGLLRVLVTTAFFITLIELTQHFFIEGRSFDVDDIILAVVGAAIGYLPVGRYLSLRVHPYHRHWWQRLLDRQRRRDRRRPAAGAAAQGQGTKTA